jgi:hypothetical protein
VVAAANALNPNGMTDLPAPTQEFYSVQVRLLHVGLTNGKQQTKKANENLLASIKFQEDHFFAAISLAHCQNFSAAKLSFSFRAAMQRAIGFGSGVRRKSFTRFPKE